MEKILEEVRVMLERCFQKPAGFVEAQYVYQRMKEIFEKEASQQSQTAMCQCIEIDFEKLKSIIKEIEEAKKGGDGWEAWSALCLWLAQYEHAQQTVQLRCPDTGLDVHECGCSVCAVMSPTNR